VSLRAPIDAVLRRACAAGAVPGVVAVAAGDDGLLYEGAFGRRDLASGAAMTIDAVFRIASMSKAVTSVAAMQLVEQGRLGLDEPVGGILAELAASYVLIGFETSGRPRLRPARRPITLRHLLTHTSGFGYPMMNADLARLIRRAGIPAPESGRLAALRLPLLFDPGDGWEYGIGTDWVGRAVEAVAGIPLDRYFAEHISGPLGMADTVFAPSPAQRTRLVRVHQRQADGSLAAVEVDQPPPHPEFWSGGSGLYSTAPDYLKLLRMILGAGRCGGVRLLRPETVAAMAANQTGDLDAGVIPTAAKERAPAFALFPEMRCHWGLGWMISPQPGPNGRAGGSLGWGGIFNSYYWVDRERRVAAAIMMQVLPFADPQALALYAAFERAVYDGLAAGRRRC
jgi:methyl acetate hydrolase